MYKKFYIKLDEPQYIKNLKLKILVEIANDKSSSDILEELNEYSNDINITFAKYAISCCGSIAMRLDKSLDYVVNMLKGFLERKNLSIVSEGLNLLKSIYFYITYS